MQYPTPSAPSPYCHYRSHTVSTAPGLSYAATPVAALTTTSLFDVFPIFPTFPKCSHPPHHPFGNPCELTLHLINRILSKHIVKLNEAESSRRLGHVRNTLWSVRRRCTLHCVIARQDSAARRRCAVVPLLQRHISDMPFIEAAFAHSAPQFSELERTTKGKRTHVPFTQLQFQQYNILLILFSFPPTIPPHHSPSYFSLPWYILKLTPLCLLRHNLPVDFLLFEICLFSLNNWVYFKQDRNIH